MPEDVYELLSLGMRYWFVLLGVLIVWRSFSWLRKDRRAKHRRLRQLPDAGMIGEMVVIVGSDELPEGTVISVPREGVLGYLRTCDIVVPVSGVAPHHLDFSFRDGKGLMVRPWRRCACQVDAEELTHRHRAYPMHHGSKLFVGDAVLRLRVFAGIKTARHAVYEEDEPEVPLYQPEPEPWQEPPYPEQQPAPWQNGYGQPAPWQQDYAPGMEQEPYQAAPYDGQPPYQQPYQPSYQQPYQQPWQAPSTPYGQEPYSAAPYAQPWVNTGYPQQPQSRDDEFGAGYPLDNAPEDFAAQSADFQHAQPRRRGRVRERRQYEEE